MLYSVTSLLCGVVSPYRGNPKCYAECYEGFSGGVLCPYRDRGRLSEW